MRREYIRTEFNCRRISVIVHRSASYKLAVNALDFQESFVGFNMVREEGRPLTTSSLGRPLRGLKRLAPLTKRPTCSKSLVLLVCGLSLIPPKTEKERQIVSNQRFVNDKLLSGKLSKCL